MKQIKPFVKSENQIKHFNFHYRDYMCINNIKNFILIKL